MSDRTAKTSSRSKKKCREAKVVKPPAFQVYLRESKRQLVRHAAGLKDIPLSQFIGEAAVEEAKRVIAEHEQGLRV